MDVFGYFSRMVSEGNEEEIYKVLGLLPLDQLEYEPILRVLLSNCLDVGRVDYGKIVFDYFMLSSLTFLYAKPAKSIFL